MSLRDLYDSLEAPEIQQWIADGRQEDLNLEFKLAPKSLQTTDERKVLAKSISAFANSAGGLIVWGVDARRDPATGVDAASGAMPLTLPELLLSKLNEYTGQATTPIVDGIQHRLTESREFAVTYVPESALPPHMAKLGHDNCYFKRSGGSSYRMEHFDLADMFGRRQRPVLALSLRHVAGTAHEFHVILANSGRASAVAPFLALRLPAPLRVSSYGFDGNGRTGLPVIDTNVYGPRFGGSTGSIIHPEQAIEITRMQWGDPTWSKQPHPPNGPYRVVYDIAAQDFPLRTAAISLTFDSGTDIGQEES